MEHGPNKNLLVRSAVVGTTLAARGVQHHTALSAARAQGGGSRASAARASGALLKGRRLRDCSFVQSVMHVSVVVSVAHPTISKVTGTRQQSLLRSRKGRSSCDRRPAERECGYRERATFSNRGS